MLDFDADNRVDDRRRLRPELLRVTAKRSMGCPSGARWLAALFLATGCSPPRTTQLELADAATMIVLDQREGGITGRVYEVSPAARIVVTSDSLRLAVLAYSQTPAELDLEKGALSLVSDGDPLPNPSRVFQLNDDESGFVEAPLSGAFLDVRLPARSRCLPLSIRPRVLEGTAIGVVPDGDLGLVATTSGFVHVGRELEPTPVPGSDRWPRGRIASQPAAELVWLVDSTGRVSFGSSARGFAEAAPFPLGLPSALAGGASAEPELWAMTSSGAVYQLRRGAWHARAPETPLRGPTRVRMAAIAPGRVWMTGTTDLFNLRQVDEDGESVIPFVGRVSSAAEGQPVLVDVEPGYGIIVGTAEHFVYLNGPDAWRGLDTPLGDLWSFFQLEGQLFGLGDQGNVQGVWQVDPTCAPMLAELERVFSVATVGDLALILGDFAGVTTLIGLEGDRAAHR
ncbi:MAG: hypothetical protein HY791_40185 [Deltaproteobacteria bacterium]|nr:hypothetical protein [Deltaproteobacteria bacterium]